MSMALKRAGIAAAEIDYINAHGTSTPLGDEIELGAVEPLLGDAASKVSMSSTKSAIGHLLGAAGAWRRSSRSWRFAITWCRRPSISIIRRWRRRSTLCRTRPSKREVNVALSNSFGFGGTNASLPGKVVDFSGSEARPTGATDGQ
jgi:3-oxoacyl-[acyl-carrier-protein] synthase II